MPHRHPMAGLLLVAAYVVLIKFGADVLTGGWPNSVALRGLHQSVS